MRTAVAMLSSRERIETAPFVVREIGAIEMPGLGPAYCLTSSTRRFLARPSSLPLSAMGLS